MTLTDLRQQVRNPLHAFVICPVIIPDVQRRMEEFIATLDPQIHAVDAKPKTVVKTDKE